MLGKIRKKIKSIINYTKNHVRRFVTRPPKMKFFYGHYYKHLEVVDNRILFESFHGQTISDSPLFMLKELVDSGEAEGYEIFYASNTNDIKTHKAFIKENNLPVTLVTVSSYKYLKVLASAKYLINNSSFPVYFIKKDDQVYLQTWHGTPLKTLGKEMRMGIESMYNVQHNFLQADYLMHPNKFTKDAIMRDYNLNNLYTGKVALSGYPRNSIFMDREADKNIREKLGLTDKTVYAYMPTWRGTSNHAIQFDSYSREVSKMLTYLDKRMKDDQVLFVNFHPIVKRFITLGSYKHIQSFPDNVNNYEFLNCTDALITDYSSVFFDYSVSGKPIVLFMYDYDDYMRDRGMYFDIKELPFAMTYDIESLTDLLVSEDILKQSYTDGEYAEKFIKYDSIDAPRKMLDLVLHGKEEGLDIEDYSHNIDIPRQVVHPVITKTKSDFNNVSKFVASRKEKYDKLNIKDIVLFEKKFFNKTVSSILYDNFNDDFDYVIITNTTPRSYFEEFMCMIGNEKVKKRLAERELKRTFPRLKVVLPYVENFFVGEEETAATSTEIIPIDAEFASDGKFLSVKLIEEGYSLSSFLLFDNKHNIVYRRDLRKNEIKNNLFKEDFLKCKEKLNMSGRYEIGGILVDNKTGEKILGIFVDKSLSYFNEKNIERCRTEDAFLKPIKVVGVGSEEFKAKYVEGEVSILTIPYVRHPRIGASILVCKNDMVLNEYLTATISSIKSSKSVSTVKVNLKLLPGMKIKDVVLRYRNANTYDVKIPFTTKMSGSSCTIVAKIDFSELELRELYWDFRVLGEWFGEEVIVKAKFKNNNWKYNFYLTNRQYYAGEGHMTFPYYTKGGCLAYMYRQDSEYDAASTVRKEIFALICYIFAKPFYKRKHIWLVYEKFCQMAQDNGYYFFKYCMEQLPEDEKKNIYYVIDKRAADYQKIKEYDDHIIQFMSFKHIFYCLAANLYIASDSRTHLFAWRSKTSMIRSKMEQRPIFFLQHGVTALKKDDQLFGKKGSSPMTYYTTTSKFEQSIITKYFGYTEPKAPVVGFARWDVLEDKKTDDDKIILIMPTWRSWLEEVSNEQFMESDYFKNYSSLLENERLDKLLEKHKTRIIFYIHPKFAGYLENFDISGDRISLIPFGTKPLNEIMMRCHMLITDYSSVCWDVYYQKKPVIFYQFDIDKYNEAHGSYIDMDNELFGRRAMNEDELVDKIEECIESGFTMLPKDIEDHNYYFEYIDDKNSDRTYKLLRNDGY
ncbi:MAG: CDP-glycerol glycerophosphotransferase family protein [Lachnospiraceae bacterium]|nr:CDP-glycerol glycerophosphotransferase family protein [Lachnospiraceae bacterium]